jgi:hypothetical protein
VGVATALRSRATVDELATPRAAFSADLRDRLVTEAVAVLAEPVTEPAPTRPQGRRERRLAAAATVAVLLGGTAGMATAAQGSLPGEALYPVKRGIEKAAVSLTGSTVGQGRELLSQASDRLREVQGLMQGGAADRAQIPGTLEDFQAEARRGAGLMVESYTSTDNPRTMMFLRSFAARNLATVQALSHTAPSDAQPGLRDAAELLRSVVSQADQLCPTCWQPELQSATTVPAARGYAAADGYAAAGGYATAGHGVRMVNPLAPNEALLLGLTPGATLDLSGGLVGATDPGALGPSSVPETTGGPDVTGIGTPAPSTGDPGSPTGEPTGDGTVPSSPPVSDPVDTGSGDPSSGPSDPSSGPSDPSTGPSDPSTGPSDPSSEPSDEPSSSPSDEPSSEPSSEPSDDAGSTAGEDPSGTEAAGDPSIDSDTAGATLGQTGLSPTADLEAGQP